MKQRFSDVLTPAGEGAEAAGKNKTEPNGRTEARLNGRGILIRRKVNPQSMKM